MYEPFLIPHLKGIPKGSGAASAGSPIEEERAIQGIPELWEKLKGTLLHSTGLPLLTALPEGTFPRIPDGTQLQTSPGRVLLLEGPVESWFVLEHPSALQLFDRLQKDRQRPALARPSLFLEWYSRALAHEDAKPGPLPSDAIGEKSIVALHEFLGQLNKPRNASDWHLEPVKDGYRSRLRVDGQLLKHATLKKKKGDWLLNSVIHAADLGNLPQDAPADGAFHFRNGFQLDIHARVSLVPAFHGRTMVVRFLHPPAEGDLNLEQLGFRPRQAEQIRALFHHPDGLWLVAGPTGSGKSTTLYSLLEIAREWNEKILTVEDPVEAIRPGLQQAQVDEKAGLTYAILLKAFMRQAPDTILIGEIRDEETAAIALQAANSGHRVLASIHASSNQGILRRFQDLGQSRGIVRASCAAVIHQRLIGLVCRVCCCQRVTPLETRESSEGLPGSLPECLAVATGCQKCVRGYSGRGGIFDLQTSLSKSDTRHSLLDSGWPLLVRQQTTLECLLPYFPRLLRRKFTLCHV
ncbi:MAG: GspE/PulE family protein [Puniceicoccaceae bacterium]